MTKTASSNTLNELGEAGIIQLVQERAPLGFSSQVRHGIGDDCAVLETGGDTTLLVTTDTLIEGVHFTAETLSPEALGWKALAVNISDIAAMGGAPTVAFLSMGLKPETKVDFLESFMTGFKDLAEKTDVVLAGGDTVESPSSGVVTITLLGNCLKEHVVYRSGARIGDDIWVTGQLGNAVGGLFLLRAKLSPGSKEYESLIRAHQRPMPPVGLGKALGESGLAHAMIDLSDGIAKDLGHICEQSGVGAAIQGPSIPMSDRLMKLADEVERSALQWALHGGEDYQLLFTASPADRERILALSTKVSGKPATKIGTIVQDAGIQLETADGTEYLELGGYLHFSS